MGRSKTIGAVALGIAVFTTALAACAPGTGQGGGGGSADKKLTYVYFTDGPDQPATRSLISKFEKQTGATVDLQIVPYSDLEQQLQARLSGGNAPDVARLVNVTPFRSDLLDLKKYGHDMAAEFLDPTRPAVTGKGGELLGLPSDLTMNGPFVNTDQFAKAGVALPPRDRPWSWDEMVTAAKKVQQANHTEFAIAYDKSGHRFGGMLSQFGTQYFTADAGVDLDPGKATAAVGLFTDLTKQDVMPKDLWLESGTKYKAASDVFLAQAAPIYFSGNWQVSQFAKAAKFGWAAIANPCQAQCGGYPGGKFMVAFKKSKNPQLAADFLAFMNSAESQREFCQTSLFLPTRKDLVASGVNYPQRTEDMAVFLSDVARTPAVAYTNNYNPAFNAMAQATTKELAATIAGKQSAEVAVQHMRDAAAKNLQDVK
jgi:alpha-1,4-digalacturonate transport system substrate-binding protein